MKYTRYFLAIALAFIVSPAFAGDACYTPAQLQAEQALRLHSELMVITVTCHQGSDGQNLATAYGDFTKKNINILHEAEQTMIAYYKSNGSGNALDQLDRLRTKLANEFGQKSADMKASAFCAAYRDKVWQFDALTHADILNEVEKMQIAEHSYVKPCAGSAGVAARESK
jgi:hypothetical protein